MEKYVKALGQAYRLVRQKSKLDSIILEIESNKPDCSCPYCGNESNKVHSTYQRKLQDFPFEGKEVVWLVRTRKFFCMNASCKYTTFAETHIFAKRNSQKTDRYLLGIQPIDMETGG